MSSWEEAMGPTEDQAWECLQIPQSELVNVSGERKVGPLLELLPPALDKWLKMDGWLVLWTMNVCTDFQLNQNIEIFQSGSKWCNFAVHRSMQLGG